MPFPPIPTRPPWAVNSTYVSGASAGAPTKVDRGLADVADGFRPGEPATAEQLNRWMYDQDLQGLALRALPFNTSRMLGPRQHTTLAIVRGSNGTILGQVAGGALAYICEESGGPDSATPGNVGISYGGEGGGARFEKMVFPDVGPGWVHAGSYSGGAPTAGSFGVWSTTEATAYGFAGTAAVVRGDLATPFAAPVDYLVACPGGKAYALKNGSTNLARVNASGDPTILGAPVTPAAGHLIAGGTFGGLDALCYVKRTSGTTVDVFVCTGANFSTVAGGSVTVTTHATLNDLRWNPWTLKYEFVLDTGEMFSVEPQSAGTTNIAPVQGITSMVRTRLCDVGYVGELAISGRMIYSNNRGQTARPLPIQKHDPWFFDGECYWFPCGALSTGAGSCDWVVTRRTT